MRKIITFLIILIPIIVGCGVSQEDHDVLQSNYEELEETISSQETQIQELTESNELLSEAKALYDQNEDIINDASLQDDLQEDIVRREVQIEELDTKLQELQGNIATEEEEIEREQEEGVTLTDDDIIKISFAGMNGSSMELYIENKTDSAFELTNRYLAINGESYGDVYSMNTIAPSSKATIEIEVNGHSSSEDINSISGGFELYNVNDFSTIHTVDFTDVNIRI